MALDKVIDSAQLDADLTAVADAIRTKGGTSEALSFPDGFVSAVEGIQAGGGGYTIADIIEDRITKVDYDGTSIGAYKFYNDKGITEVSLPNVTYLGERAFQGCSALKKVSIPELSKVNQYTFAGATIEDFYAPNVTTLGIYALRSSTSLVFIDLPKINNISAAAFNGCSQLKTVVLRNAEVATLGNTNAFQGTPFESGNTGGTVYVPSALITQYQQATNWSTLYTAGTCNFVAIEGSEYE